MSERPPDVIPEKGYQTLEADDAVAEETKADCLTTSDDMYQFLVAYQEDNAGRLVLDPRAAPAELGNEVAKCLKLSTDGSKILWPQPTDDLADPQNWTNIRKSIQLTVVTLACMIPDFSSSIGIPAVFAMASEFSSTPNRVNQLGSSWAIFLLGWGGVIAVMFIRRYGRLPVLFWSQVIGLATIIGVTLAPNLNTSAAMRCLNGFFTTCAQVSGLYVVADMYPLHLQARKLSIWTAGFVLSPVLAPFFLGFLIAKANWRWSYAIGSIISAITVLLVTFCMEETMYDRHLRDTNPLRLKRDGLRYRIETLIGITGARMARYRDSWSTIAAAPMRVLRRPHMVAALLFEGVLFGFGIGLHVTNTVILARPPPVGYGYDLIQISGTYASSIVAVILGEIVGRYLIDWLLEVAVRRNKGVFEAECRLWACYPAVILYAIGFILQGASLEKHFSIAVLVVGWIFVQFAVMVNTSAIYAYCNDCCPRYQGEISALLNLFRSFGGFSVAFYQVDWVSSHGALQAFGCEAAIVVGLFVFIIPVLQLKGQYLRARFSA